MPHGSYAYPRHTWSLSFIKCLYKGKTPCLLNNELHTKIPALLGGAIQKRIKAHWGVLFLSNWRNIVFLGWSGCASFRIKLSKIPDTLKDDNKQGYITVTLKRAVVNPVRDRWQWKQSGLRVVDPNRESIALGFIKCWESRSVFVCSWCFLVVLHR